MPLRSAFPARRPATTIPRLVTQAPAPLSPRRILALWWPLAASWLLMGTELPLFTACVARMRDPEVQLAAYGSLVFPLALVIEAPIMMLLAAATALATDQDSWRKLRSAMHVFGGALTALHVVIAFTPLFDWVARTLFDIPEQVVEPARLGLRVMTPWTWSIAYRRAHQGVLIRFEKVRPVVLGSFLRLAANATVYGLAFAALRHGVELPGILAGTASVAAGVTTEAVFIGWCTRRVLRERGLPERPPGPQLTRRSFLAFYVPLALTPLIALVTQPMGAAAMARMELPLASLAVWPAVHGLLFLLRSGGFAYNEVVISLLDSPGATRALRRFGVGLGAVTSALLFLVAATPLARIWFGDLSGLSPELGALAASALACALPWPAVQAVQSWLQGSLVHRRRTRQVTEGMLVFCAITVLLLFAAVRWSPWSGVRSAVLALVTGSVVQTAWLGLRVRLERRVPAAVTG
jgi:hypothetical protein